MGCGCSKAKQVATKSSAKVVQAPGGPPAAGRVAMYQVVKDGEVVLETKSPVKARGEASRLRAHLRVTSVEATSEELAAVGG